MIHPVVYAKALTEPFRLFINNVALGLLFSFHDFRALREKSFSIQLS